MGIVLPAGFFCVCFVLFFLQNYDKTVQDERLLYALIQNEMEALTIYTLIFIKVES